MCFAKAVPKVKSNNLRNVDRKAEIQIIRDFADKLIREGKAMEFLVQHGFVKQSGDSPSATADEISERRLWHSMPLKL